MQALQENIGPQHYEQAAGPTHRPAGIVRIWAQGRRRITPRAYRHLRPIAATRLAAGAFLVVVGALLLSHGQPGWAVIPLAGAALNISIGGLDMAAAVSAPRRG